MQAVALNLAAWPVRLEYFSGWTAAGLFLLLGSVIVVLGMRSLSGLGPVRQWVAIGARLAVLLLFILILGGIRWQRTHKDLEVMLLRDVSESAMHVRDFPGANRSLQEALDDYFRKASEAKGRPAKDRVGLISFANTARIDAMPSERLLLDARAIREPGSGTDVASAIQLALATLSRDAMHRMVLVWDGNSTAGDLDSALSAAVAAGVPVDVLPLRYSIENEVMVERMVAPTWHRENEPFTLEVILHSSNATTVQGKLSVTHQDRPMDLDPATEGVQATRAVTLRPGRNVERVRVPGLTTPGVHQFRAVFEGQNVTAGIRGAGGGAVEVGGPAQGDTLTRNNAADAFTFVRGKGRVLYIDNVADGRGRLLKEALEKEEINLEAKDVSGLPTTLLGLQNYDAVVLANVPRGPGGLSTEQDQLLATYVHDMGGGLVMIGGPDAFGAGGWQGSEVEKVLPVSMDIPAQRQIPKGSLVLVMHSCEMPNGNYWGLQCAQKAAEALSERDEIGVISYGWGGGPGGGGAQWDFNLAEKGDGEKVRAAIKKMQLGDMPSFDEAMDVALNGKAGEYCLAKSDAKQKHVIIISDMDPQAPQAALVNQYKAHKVTVSTVAVYPHGGGAAGAPPGAEIARMLGGRAYGPINNNFNQLPQIFIKEATVVRRSLIFEDNKGIAVVSRPSTSEMVKGLSGTLQPIYGMVLTTRKGSPQIEVPLVAGRNADPLLAHWQTGLGKAAAFASDAHNRWLAGWVGSAEFGKFWAQVVRGVSRPPMSGDFDIQTTLSGDKAKVVVEALNKEGGHLNFLAIAGQVVGPNVGRGGGDAKPRELKLVQTGPGVYEAEFDAREEGNHVVVLNYRGPKGEGGVLLSGLAVNSSPELRDLRSNEAALRQIAQRTKGRLLEPWNAEGADLFSRQNVAVTASPMPVWDVLLPVLLALILLDVAIRRIAWDWAATKRLANLAVQRMREFTGVRKVESAATMEALKRKREEVAEQRFKPAEAAEAADRAAPPLPRPDPKAKFQAPEGVEGDITEVVGGATDKPIPPPPKKVEPKGAPPSPGGHTGSLLEAKRRAQQKMKERQEGEG